MAPGPGDMVEIGLSQGTALPPHKAGKEVRKGEVFYSWGQEGQNTQSCMASALTRGGWGGLWERGEGSDCAWVGTEPPALGRGVLPMNGPKGSSSRTRPSSLSHTCSLIHPQGTGWRQAGWAKPFSFLLWGQKDVTASGRVREGPGLYLAQGDCSWHSTVWATTPLLRGSTQGHSLRLSLSLHPRLGTKDFKFWLRCSSRGHQTSTTWKPGAHVTVWGKHGCTNTGSPG